MVLKIHWLTLMCHNGLPHLAHAACTVRDKAKHEAVAARDTMKDSLRRDALAAKALDHKLTRLYIFQEPETDSLDLVLHHRRYMNG
jgi:hypothetical protein